jgi:hypothetical protein
MAPVAKLTIDEAEYSGQVQTVLDKTRLDIEAARLA